MAASCLKTVSTKRFFCFLRGRSQRRPRFSQIKNRLRKLFSIARILNLVNLCLLSCLSWNHMVDFFSSCNMGCELWCGLGHWVMRGCISVPEILYCASPLTNKARRTLCYFLSLAINIATGYFICWLYCNSLISIYKNSYIYFFLRLAPGLQHLPALPNANLFCILLWVAYCLLPIAHCLLTSAYWLCCLLPTAYCYCLPPTNSSACWPLPSAYCLLLPILPTEYCPLITAYFLLPTAYFLLPALYCLLPTARNTDYYPLTDANCLLPIAYFLLPTAYCTLLPTAYCFLLIAYSIPPAT